MKRINSNWYTKGKFGKGFREILDRKNENLYSKGRYPTKIKKEDLPKDYFEFQSRTIEYMTGYIKTSNVKDIYYSYVKENHLFKDDYLYISYNNKLKFEENRYGNIICEGYDFCVCGSDNIPILFEIEKNSNIDTTEVRKAITEKFNWWKENEKEDYIRYFNNREVEDIFEYYKEILNAKIYIISDTHFNHNNIIKYCNRPFKDVEEMNKVIIDNWNSIVTDYDTIFHLGDFALTKESGIKDIISKLNGKKVLIRGNHDRKSIEFFRNAGFYVINENSLKLDKEKVILSHKPLKDVDIPKGYINIHGHIHDKPLHKINPTTSEMEYPKELYSEKLHINASVEVIGYKPISIEKLLQKVEK